MAGGSRMAALSELRAASRQLFGDLLSAQGPGESAEAPPPGFSWFVEGDALRAGLLAVRLSAAAAARSDENDGLQHALDIAERERPGADPELIRQGLALFVTHNDRGRNLLKPRTAQAAPNLFTPPTAAYSGPTISIGGLAPGLDYWREDILANEHHQHWHEVYPFIGRPPASFAQWIGEVEAHHLVALLEAIHPTGLWAETVADSSSAEVAEHFSQELTDAGRNRLVAAAMNSAHPLHWSQFRRLFNLNDRHGELFIYMHQQMLARYDAELLSHDLARVEPLGPTQWSEPIAEGYDPEVDPEEWPFTIRNPGQTIRDGYRSQLSRLQLEVDEALANGTVADKGVALPLTADSFGEFVERRLHNTGHNAIAELSEPRVPHDDDTRVGVMASTLTAIRDQAFWRWHKHIDNIGFAWQDTLEPEAFDDAPAVMLRGALSEPDHAEWSSPDIILVNSADLPQGLPPAEMHDFGANLFGGAAWDADFTAATAHSGEASLQTTDELVTFLRTQDIRGYDKPVTYLKHEPFSYFVRTVNTGEQPQSVTVRIFLVPAAEAHDRRAWIEMDKFPAELRPGQNVLYRPDRESSVIKRRAETSPADIESRPLERTALEQSYCDCGWPYTLLLPRGTEGGLECRVLVMMTNAVADGIVDPGSCGSVSFCGSRDRYPDRREMGYPFARRFAGPTDTALANTLLPLPNVAARTVRIRHSR